MENSQNNDIQQQIYQFQYLKEQRDSLAQNLGLISASLQNYMTTKATIENLKNIKEGEEVLVPIGGSIIIKANIQKTDKILTYVGQDVVVEKDLEEANQFIEKIIQQHNEQIKYLNNELYKLDTTLQGMSQLIQQSNPPK